MIVLFDGVDIDGAIRKRAGMNVCILFLELPSKSLDVK